MKREGAWRVVSECKLKLNCKRKQQPGRGRTKEGGRVQREASDDGEVLQAYFHFVSRAKWQLVKDAQRTRLLTQSATAKCL